MASYLMGIDNGLTVSKAAILDLEGREVAVQGHKVEMNYPRPAWVERDSEIVWQTTAAAIRDLRRPGLPWICRQNPAVFSRATTSR